MLCVVRERVISLVVVVDGSVLPISMVNNAMYPSGRSHHLNQSIHHINYILHPKFRGYCGATGRGMESIT